MEKFEWGNTTRENGNVLVIDESFLDVADEDIPEHASILEIKESGLDGYIDRDRAYKISDPSLPNMSSVKLKQHTLIQGDDNIMSDNTENQHSELKEDLRNSERRISDDVKERDQRLERESARREERFEKSLEQFANDAKEREERYIKSVDEIKQIVSDGESNRRSTTAAMWTLAITTIIGIAAMVVTVVLSV